MAFVIFSGFIFCVILYKIYTYFYFSGQDFRSIKQSIEKYTIDCNQFNDHIQNLKNSYIQFKSLDYGDAVLFDTSKYNMKRRGLDEKIKNHWTHNCTASVFKNASDQPFKYFCKYFDVKINEQALSGFEQVLNDFSAAEQGKLLLKNQLDEIIKSIDKSIPFLILRFSRSRLIRELGFNEIDLSDLYFPIYTFHYVSAGGNSSMKLNIRFNIETLDRFISYLDSLVKYRKSVAGQRALMTSALREKIKVRDNFTCQICYLSTSKEANLLLEIDHIVPLSKGGITSEKNLQTLCWRCNRSKGAKYTPALNNTNSV